MKLHPLTKISEVDLGNGPEPLANSWGIASMLVIFLREDPLNLTAIKNAHKLALIDNPSLDFNALLIKVREGDEASIRVMQNAIANGFDELVRQAVGH